MNKENKKDAVMLVATTLMGVLGLVVLSLFSVYRREYGLLCLIVVVAVYLTVCTAENLSSFVEKLKESKKEG